MTSFLRILLSESTQEKHLTLKTEKKFPAHDIVKYLSFPQGIPQVAAEPKLLVLRETPNLLICDCVCKVRAVKSAQGQGR